MAIEQAHAEMWRRFIDRHGVIIDFTALDGSVRLPSPEECRLGKPNALGWWSPIENGAMFNGQYMDAIVNRWRLTQSADDARKARRLMQGLLLLNSISAVKGFIGRGVSSDGRSHYPMGSDDQTLPWFYGLWRYYESGIATPAEEARIRAHLTEAAGEIVRLNWSMPAEPPFGTRGTFRGFTFKGAARQLFVCKLMHAVTGGPQWAQRYQEGLREEDPATKKTRLSLCERGLTAEDGRLDFWTSCSDVASLRGLWELERETAVKEAFARGLEASAARAMQGLPLAGRFDSNDGTVFDPDWRMMNQWWKPQTSAQESENLAKAQLREFLRVSPRRAKETAYVREPTSASWVVTLAPDAATLRQRVPAIEAVITRYDYARLYYSQFFWVESAWWRLKSLG